MIHEEKIYILQTRAKKRTKLIPRRDRRREKVLYTLQSHANKRTKPSPGHDRRKRKSSTHYRHELTKELNQIPDTVDEEKKKKTSTYYSRVVTNEN